MVKKIGALIFLIFLPASSVYAADEIKNVFSEGKFFGQFRAYGYERDFDDKNSREDIAVGGNFYYRTAPLYHASLGMAFYTAQTTSFNNDEKDVYGLLAEDADGDHESFSVLGEAFIEFSGSDSSLKFGRQELETPFINTDDNRLTPQSTNAFVLTNASISNLKFIIAHVTHMRGKASTEFDYMSEYAGIDDEKEAVSFAGVEFGLKGLKVQLWDYYAHEYLNDAYFKAEYSYETSADVLASCAYQHLLQVDVGDKIGGELDTYMYTFEGSVEIYGLTLALARGRIGDDDLHYPWGHDMIISGQLNDLGRAEEIGSLAKIAYDFSKIGLSGLSGKALYMGFDTPEHGNNASPDYNDIDWDLKYSFSGLLEGLKIRLRHAVINEDEKLGGEDYTDSRVYIMYDFSL